VEVLLAQKTADFSSAKRKIETADGLIESGEVEKGLQILKEQALSRKNTKVYAQWVLGIKAMRHREKSLQIKQLNAALYPSHFAVHNELGYGFYQNKDFDSALRHFQKSNLIAPFNAVARMMINKINFTQKDFAPLLLGNYSLERLGRNNEILDTLGLSIEVSEQNPKKYLLTITKEGNKQVINSYEGNADRIWFKVPGNFGELEYSLWMHNEKYLGSFSGMFGNNGTIRVTRR
jgi:tetratricopeptide (TPR) repeat protein